VILPPIGEIVAKPCKYTAFTVPRQGTDCFRTLVPLSLVLRKQQRVAKEQQRVAKRVWWTKK
jgi:hypothetical protein